MVLVIKSLKSIKSKSKYKGSAQNTLNLFINIIKFKAI